MFFLQMSGFPGSGKSTLAKAIAKRIDAVIVDHDIQKSALLHSIDGSLFNKMQLGNISYNIDWALIDFLLAQGKCIIFDSPCLYDEVIDRGMGLANKYHIKYKYIECYLDDMQEVNERLRNRKRMISQIEAVASEENFIKTLKNSKKPPCESYLVVNTKDNLEDYIDRVMDYIKE